MSFKGSVQFQGRVGHFITSILMICCEPLVQHPSWSSTSCWLS